MRKYLGKLAIITAMGGLVVSTTLDAAPKPPASKVTPPAKGSALPEETQEIILKDEKGKDRRCKIVESKKLPDGTIQHKLKALDNGEEMTIVEAPPEKSKTPIVPTPEVTQKLTAPKPESIALPNLPDPNMPLPEPTKTKQTVKKPAEKTEAVKETAAPKTDLQVSNTTRKGIFGNSKSTESRPGFFGRLFGRRPAESPMVQPSSAPINTPTPTPAPTPMNKTQPMVQPTPVAPTLPPTNNLPMQLPKGNPTENPFSSISKGPMVPQGRANVNLAERIPTLPENLGVQQAVYNKSEPLLSFPAGDLRDVLKNDLMPSKREEAAEKLMNMQGKRTEIRELLLESIKTDPAATVRMTCLICLSKTGIRDVIYRDAVKMALEDKDVRVRNVAKAMK